MTQKQTVIVIDGIDFSRHQQQLSGQMAVTALDRVADQLTAKQGFLIWELQGQVGREEDRQFALRLSIRGELQLRCQRCLQSLSLKLAIDRRLMLVTPKSGWPEEDIENEEVDAIEASAEMQVEELIQEEVLLALPIAPRHDHCDPPESRGDGLLIKASPFAVLQRLKHH